MANHALTFVDKHYNLDMLKDKKASEFDYDAFAWLYEKYWAPDYAKKLLPIISKYVLCKLNNGASILDLCCGSGTISIPLSDLGFFVTGIDYSKKMIELLFNKSKKVEAIVKDIRLIDLQRKFDAVICTYDSLNYMENEEDLRIVFKKVYNHLNDNGTFFFDINIDKAYKAKIKFGKWFNIIKDDHICVMEGMHDIKKKCFQVYGVLLIREKEWTRQDFILTQHYFNLKVIQNILKEIGFRSIIFFEGRRDLSLEVCEGKYFFIVGK